MEKMEKENFTNVAVTMLGHHKTKVILDPPIQKVHSMRILSLHDLKRTSGPSQVIKNLVFCSLVDENSNYSELKKPENTTEGLVSKQVRSKYLGTFINLINATLGIKQKLVKTKTEEYVGEFEIWLEKRNGVKLDEKDLVDVDMIICLRLNH